VLFVAGRGTTMLRGRSSPRSSITTLSLGLGTRGGFSHEL
jgi:hypothetical protein